MFTETVAMCKNCGKNCGSLPAPHSFRSKNALLIKALSESVAGFNPVAKTVDAQRVGRKACHLCRKTVVNPVAMSRDIVDEWLVSMSAKDTGIKYVFLCKSLFDAETVASNARFRGDQKHVSIGRKSNLYRKTEGLEYIAKGVIVRLQTPHNAGGWYLTDYFKELKNGQIKQVVSTNQ